jgi:hypothetical protein
MAKKLKRRTTGKKFKRSTKYEVCKKGDVRGTPPVAAPEDGWIYAVVVDGNETHSTFRPPTRTKDYPGFDEAWEIQ